jgi:cytochrome c5
VKKKFILASATMVAMALFYIPVASAKSAPPENVTAKTVCSRCHDTSSTKVPTRQDRDGSAPAFVLIAHDAKMTPAALRKFLLLPHGDMNNILVTEAEIDALIGYIQSLKSADRSGP